MLDVCNKRQVQGDTQIEICNPVCNKLIDFFFFLWGKVEWIAVWHGYDDSAILMLPKINPSKSSDKTLCFWEKVTDVLLNNLPPVSIFLK